MARIPPTITIVVFSIIVLTTCQRQPVNKDWLKTSIVYQIYPRSFKDSNGDGIGDLNGITSKLEHIADIGVDALWLSPIYTSPQKDFGYDIANFTNIHSEYGTLDDFDRLIARAKSLNLRVLLDFVPNHSSTDHPWFKKSVNKIKPYDNYYIWRNGRTVNGVRNPPNNWLSVFGGSAWEWNPTRKQYYLHQFVAGQPDLNYRDASLNEEMREALTFWMNRGVEGFRIDAINFMFEDPRFLNEPRSNSTGLPIDDYNSLSHIYSKDLDETYTILRSWRQLLDDHSRRANAGKKIILTEAYASLERTVQYYEAGSTAPMNFMFMVELNDRSTALDFKYMIDRWLNNVPNGEEYVPNWVVGNHDNHRAASRFGRKRGDQLSMLSIVLPGIGIIYNGDEIGMEDRAFTYEETIDPAGCLLGPERYQLGSRDPERTPFQWDDTRSAGFSSNPHTWLPVNNNYKTLNLKVQKTAKHSHYKVFKALSALKRKPIIQKGTLEVVLVTNKVLGVVRRVPGYPSIVVLLINFSNTPLTVDARTWLNIPEKLSLYTSSIYSGLTDIGSDMNTSKLRLPGATSIVLTTPNLLYKP